MVVYDGHKSRSAIFSGASWGAMVSSTVKLRWPANLKRDLKRAEEAQINDHAYSAGIVLAHPLFRTTCLVNN
jgi:hypothetical protein